MRLWHERMGHLSEKSLLKLEKIVQGMDEAKTYCTCEACVLGRMREGPHKGKLPEGNYLGEVIFSDVCGPYHIPGYRGERYWLTIIDSYSRLSALKPMKDRTKVWSYIGKFVDSLASLEKQGRKCRIVHADKGGEYISKAAEDWGTQRGIDIQWAPTEQHESNGMAESFNITIRDKLLPTMIGGNIPPSYWPEVAATINYLRNRSPHNALDITPFEKAYGQRPNISHIRTLGTKLWYLLPSTKRKKLDEKSATGILVGYSSNSIYRILTPDGKVIEAARQNTHFDTERAEKERSGRPNMVSAGTQTDYASSGVTEFTHHFRFGNYRTSASQILYQDTLNSDMHSETVNPYPKTGEALRDPNSKEWLEGMKVEHQSLVDNETWTLVPRTKDMHVLRGKWVYKLKRGPNNEITRFKARWVVRGFEQIEGIDYFETFASVVKPMSYKILFAMAAAWDLEIEQMDVKTAFLYGEIEEDIYVEQPHEFEDGSKRVCKLRRALYGLKQAPRVWFKTLSDFLATLGFKSISADCGVFTNTETGIFIAVYVDDLLIVGKDLSKIKDVKVALGKRFQMTDLGPCQYASNPTPTHEAAVKRIFRYLSGTKNFCLIFRGPLQPLTGWTDADWGGDLDTRRSTSGYIFNLGSGAISWSSKLQQTTALSTCEAEYRGTTNAAKEAMWLSRLYSELNTSHGGKTTKVPREPSAVVIYSDNQGSIALAKNPTQHNRNRHIDIQAHFIREQVEQGTILLEWVRTEDMIADGLTKPLPKDMFEKFREALGLQKIPGDQA
ncbi:hypothetical protein ONZ43_g6683 [Nemania bipapillata]|uniref:Uncharacterized protein n=1 Tax=Nemania bipapillata TaxID=110536 RepID=A0ACC2HXR8_9PEZI|nr:hypothetical protein ONZ43_g6683 [Nemania bipapillata]